MEVYNTSMRHSTVIELAHAATMRQFGLQKHANGSVLGNFFAGKNLGQYIRRAKGFERGADWARLGTMIGTPAGAVVGGVAGALKAEPDENMAQAALRGAGKGALAGGALGFVGGGGLGMRAGAREGQQSYEDFRKAIVNKEPHTRDALRNLLQDREALRNVPSLDILRGR
jgi:hypothetical protein